MEILYGKEIWNSNGRSLWLILRFKLSFFPPLGGVKYALDSLEKVENPRSTKTFIPTEGPFPLE